MNADSPQAISSRSSSSIASQSRRSRSRSISCDTRGKSDRSTGASADRENAVVACDWLLVDGSSMIFRAYYGVRPTVDGPGGMQVNAIQGFLERLGRLIRQRKPRRLAIADDFAWRPAW